MKRRSLRGWWLTALAAFSIGVRAEPGFYGAGEFEPGEAYRQLSLVMLVTGGAQDALVDALPAPDADAGQDGSGFDPDAYRTPLTRIVDQETMLRGSARLFRYGRDQQAAIRDRLLELETGYPDILAGFNMNVVTEDAILIRQAIADSIEFAGLGARPDLQPALAQYRLGTVRLRNVLEYEQFSAELDRLTEEAIRAVGGKLDAYQRMFEDELGTSTFDRHIDAAEYIYTREFDQRAGDLTKEIIDSIVLLESQPNR